MTNPEDATPPAVGPLLVRGVRPCAWMWLEAIWLEGDVRGRGWYPRIERQEPNWPTMQKDVQPLYDQAALDSARQAIYEAEAEQMTAPLRAKIAELEAAEEGAKLAFGHVVAQKRAAERECTHLRGLLDDAYAQIRRQAELLNSMA